MRISDWSSDVCSSDLFDPDKLHVLDHKGPHLSVRGPLNIARPVQGWPVIVQAGASEPGRQLAAETAEVIFGAEQTIEGGKARSEEHTSELQSLMRTSYAVLCLNKKKS